MMALLKNDEKEESEGSEGEEDKEDMFGKLQEMHKEVSSRF